MEGYVQLSATRSARAATGGSARRWAPQPSAVILVAAFAALVFLIVVPAGKLLVASLQNGDTGAWTFGNYVEAYNSALRLRALGTSLMYASSVTVLSTLFAVPVAWGIARTDMPGKALIRPLILGAFITPSYLGSIGWILLAGPNAGWLNKVFMAVTGAPSGFANIYTFAGLVWVTALYGFPYIFVFTTDALERVSSEMEEAANILGASGLRTIFRITLPLVTPAILGGAIVVFLDTVALFGTPAILALPARIHVLTLELWGFFQFPLQAEVAAAYAIPLVLITVGLFTLQRRVLGRRSYVSLTGKGGSRELQQLGAWRWVVFGYAFFLVAMAVILPYLALAQAAFSQAWGRGFSLSNLTLANFRLLLIEDPTARETILHSFTYSGATAFVAVALALAVAYVVQRRLVGRWGGLLGMLCMLPLVVPGIVLAIGFYSAWAPPPVALYGTATILVLGFTSRFLPIAYSSCLAAVRALNPEMEEAVRILGGGRLRAISRVVVPLLKTSLVGAWLLVFIPATRELSTAIFLVSAHTRVISVMMLDLSENGSFEALAALGFFLLGVTILIVATGYKLVGRDFLLRRG